MAEMPFNLKHSPFYCILIKSVAFVVERFFVPRCFTVPFGEWFSKDHIAFLDCLTLKVKLQQPIKLLGTACPMTQHHIPEDMDL